MLDGEIACVDAKGRPRFKDLLFRRKEPRFFAFDLLHLNGNDFSCLIEFANGDGASIRSGKPAIASGLWIVDVLRLPGRSAVGSRS
jgi:hypothetical protein